MYVARSSHRRTRRTTRRARLCPRRYDTAGNLGNSFDAHGNNPTTHYYDEKGRLVRTKLGTADSAAPSIYHYYNENGQRIFRTEPLTDAAFAQASPTGALTASLAGTAYYYNGNGKLIFQNGTGQTSPHSQGAYYFWLGDIPVGYFDGSGVYNIYADHLNTPRSLYNWNEAWSGSLQPVWQWHYSAYGGNQPVVRRHRFKPHYWDALNLGATQEDTSSPDLVFDIRYPGQYYDHSTGLHQNWMRMYDPTTGRYTRADPIGLNGGMNRYAYVGGNALWAVDEMGLESGWPTYVTPTPEMTKAGIRLQGLADMAAKNVDSTCGSRCIFPWIRGTLIHSEFKRLIDTTCPNTSYSTEVSYKDGLIVPYGTEGSSRADVVFGPRDAPHAVFDLKTGWAYITLRQGRAYGKNLPLGTPFATIKPDGG